MGNKIKVTTKEGETISINLSEVESSRYWEKGELINIQFKDGTSKLIVTTDEATEKLSPRMGGNFPDAMRGDV